MLPPWTPYALTILVALGFVAWISRVFRAGVQTTELQPFIEMVVTKAITDAIVREDGAIRKRLDEQKKMIDAQEEGVKSLRIEFNSAHAIKIKHLESIEEGILRIEEGIDLTREDIRHTSPLRDRSLDRSRRSEPPPEREERPSRTRTPPRPKRS